VCLFNFSHYFDIIQPTPLPQSSDGFFFLFAGWYQSGSKWKEGFRGTEGREAHPTKGELRRAATLEGGTA
jgi:hypothetical protein